VHRLGWPLRADAAGSDGGGGALVYFAFDLSRGQWASSRRYWRARSVGEKGAGRGQTRQRAPEGRKISRGDIVIGRPAISLKAWPSTHDTISHLYGVDDGEALPFA